MFYHIIESDSITRRDLKKYNSEYVKLLKRYCSVNYKQEFFRRKNLSYRLVNRFYNILIRLLNKKSSNSRNLIQENIKDPIWDGGFN